MKTRLTQTEKYSISVSIAFAIVVICVLFSLVSCSARNVTKTEDVKKEETKTDISLIDTSKTIKKNTTNLVILDSSNTDEIIISPIDSTKEMTVNGKKYKNAKISHKKHKRNRSIEFKQKIEQSHKKAVVFKDNSIKKVSEKHNNKVIEKKALIPSWIWLILLLLLIVGARVAYFYYKGTNPFLFITRIFKR